MDEVLFYISIASINMAMWLAFLPLKNCIVGKG
jgi:hypothetical protein